MRPAALAGGRRRTAAAAPVTFPAGAAVLDRWKANDLALADGAAVSSWAPTTGSATLTQGTAASRPTLRTGILNGKSVVRFDGNDDWLDATLTAADTQPFTVYVLFSASPLNNATRQILTAGQFELYLTNLTTTTATRDSWSNSSRTFGTYTAGTWELWAVVVNGATSPIYINGTQASAGSFGSASFGTALSLGRHPTSFRNIAGDIAEVVHCDGVHDSTQIAAMHAYFKAEYALAAIP